MNNLFENKKKILLYLLLFILIIFLCFARYNLVKNVPILANAGAMEDDELFVAHTKSILDGKWLGEYTYNTLCKNIFFSVFLTLCKIVRVSYTNIVTIFYIISSILFMISLRKFIKSKIALITIFTLLLFNPIMYSIEVFQRVYRNAIIPQLTIMVISSYIAMFLNRNEKCRYNIIWSIMASISFSAFYYTREDSMWLVPFVVFIIFCSIVGMIVNLIKEKKWVYFFIKIFLLILPVIVTILTGNYIANKNEKYYGEKIINTSYNGSFSETLNKIYSVKPNVKIDKVTNTREKMDRISKVSKSFSTIKPELDKYMDIYAGGENEELINGLFSWALMLGTYNSGYDSLPKANELYNNIIREIDIAFENGTLEKQNLMPILGCEVLDKEGYIKWFSAIVETIKYIGNYNNIELLSTQESMYYPGLYNYMEMFKEITGNRVILAENAMDIDGNLMIELNDQEEYIESLQTRLSILGKIKNCYNFIAKIVEFLGIISYILLTIIMIVDLFKKKYNCVEGWIISSSILGTIFTLVVGVAYVHISQVSVMSYFYLVGAFPLYIIFSGISLYNICNRIILGKEKRKDE